MLALFTIKPNVIWRSYLGTFGLCPLFYASSNLKMRFRRMVFLKIKYTVYRRNVVGGLSGCRAKKYERIGC